MIEICCFNLQSAINAEKAGANRVELCDNFLEGGTTPSFATIKLAREKLDIPIHVLIRPRGGDFLYSDLEMEIIREDIITCKKLGIEGIVIGFLNQDGNVDIDQCKEIMQLAKPMSVTFHRAFDVVKSSYDALEEIIKLGFERILTSGAKNSSVEGKEKLRILVELARDRIIIMPGGGITPGNIKDLANYTKAKEFHLSAKSFINSKMQYQHNEVSFSDHPELGQNKLIESDIESIQNAITELNKV